MKRSFFVMSIALITGLATGPAAADTTLIGSVVSNTIPALNDLAAAYAKKHPGTTIRFVPGGSKTISNNINRGLPSDFVVIGETFVPQTQNLLAPTRLLVNRTVIAVAPAAKGKITKPEDLAASGVRVGSGTPGEALELFSNQTFAKLDAKYGNGYAAKVKANITLVRIDDAQLVDALKAGKIDAAVIFAADALDGGLTNIDLGESSVTIIDDAAVLKDSSHIAEAKDFIAFAHSPEGIAIIRKHGHEI
jgi:molybdate transport system substrate-binding protein